MRQIRSRARASRWGPRKMLQFGLMVASASGVASSSATLNGFGRVVASTDGDSSTSGVLRGSGRIVATSEGETTLSGTLRASTTIAALSSGVGTTSVILRGSGRLVGDSQGSVTFVAVLKGMITPSIMGAAGGASTFVAVMRGNAVLVATAAGTVSFIARLGMGLVPGSIDELHGLIRSKWATDMELGLPIPTHYDNAPFDKPEDARWVRLRILTDDSVHVAESSAGHVFRNLGIMQANVYVPIEGGDTPAHEVADAIAAAFDDVAINSELLFRQTRIDGALRQADEWRVSVTTPFQHTVTNTKLSSVSGDSTTFEEIANHIRERYSDEITTAESIPTQFDNAPFDIPEASLWSSLTVQFGDRVTSELGATLRKRVVGNIVGAVFVPIETGERDGLRAADKVKDAFRTVTIKGVTFRAATVRNVGRVGPWWQINATVPFLVHP